ncbi:MAG: type VI secretion system contractile sheath large subunit, partial [Acidobacteria bacterium]|nr:type VI secretion system contractile sheath large subunit [Acidobacteriota bacterium]
ASAAVGTPFVSHIRPGILGVKSLAEHADPDDWDLSGASNEGKLWTALRELPEASHVGMTMPRFLARLPYGEDTEPAEAFAFEEFTDESGHDEYLWSNGCFAVAQLLARTYSEFGWNFGGRFVQDVDGLPLHVFKKDGETVYQSCAEVQLSQNASEKLAEYGLMPLVSFKNMDRIRLVRLQSISSSVGTLGGRWR